MYSIHHESKPSPLSSVTRACDSFFLCRHAAALSQAIIDGAVHEARAERCIKRKAKKA